MKLTCDVTSGGFRCLSYNGLASKISFAFTTDVPEHDCSQRMALKVAVRYFQLYGPEQSVVVPYGPYTLSDASQL